jgi:hypothetical protein
MGVAKFMGHNVFVWLRGIGARAAVGVEEVEQRVTMMGPPFANNYKFELVC